ncbi:MAG TPA: hypothetical protein VFC63_01455, partial [Blastocatellia bacterium]|nr:hypothetical protein [Blastocatellia bacterium]
MRLTIGSARFDWQTSKSNTFTARYDFNENRLQNQGIGGFSLSDHGFNTNTLEHALRFSDTTVIGTTMVNEARVGITYIHVGESALSQAPAILVPGAFSSGGAIAQSQLSNDLHVEIDDVLSTIAGKHKLKFGGQILGKLSGDTRADNFNGTFIFGGGLAPQLDSNNLVVSNAGVPVLVSISGLEEYRRTLLGLPGGTPTQFSITSGNPAIHVNQWQFSAFVEDDWKLHPNLTLSMGLRYEGQTNPTDKLSLAPRFGVAYAVDKKQHWIIRGHIGVFYSRIPDALDFDVLRLNGQREQQIIINNPSFPNPFGTGSISATVPTVRELQPGITPEASLQGQIAIEHQFPHGLALYFNESYSKGWNVLRSININAPVLNATADPLTAPRPLGINENILQYQSNGETSGPVTFIGIKQSDNKHFNVFAGYLYFHLLSNADTPQT